MLTSFFLGEYLVERLAYLIVYAGKESSELALELTLDGGDVVGVGLCFEAKSVLDL
jgi:hypothetical protein